MFTILLTIIGLIVGLIGVLTANRKTGFKYFARFVITGVVIDVLIFTTLFIAALCRM